MMALLCMWFGISMPLVYLGYYFGFRKQPYDNPVRTNQIPRQVPEQRWYMNKFVGWVLIRSSNLLCASYWDCWWLQCSIWTLELMLAVFITYRMFSFHQNPDGWNPTIWCHVHRTLLHFQCKPNCSALNASWSMQIQINSSSPVCNSVQTEYLKIVHRLHLKRNHWCEFSGLVLLCTVMSTSLCVSPPLGHLGESVLLPLRLPVSGLHYLGGLLLPDQYCHGLFPALCRGEFI